jgi:CBS domain-containing protein
MFDLRVKDVMEHGKLLATGADTTVTRAAKMMAVRAVGAILVVEGERLLGIFTERDALFRVVAAGRDPRTTPLADVMTPCPRTVAPRVSFGAALLVMHENGFRHLPVVDGGAVIGIISARNALDPDLEEFTAEARRREHLQNDRPA